MNEKSFESDFVPNNVDCSLMAVQRIVQINRAPLKNLHSGKIDQDMTAINFFTFIEWRVFLPAIAGIFACKRKLFCMRVAGKFA